MQRTRELPSRARRTRLRCAALSVNHEEHLAQGALFIRAEVVPLLRRLRSTLGENLTCDLPKKVRAHVPTCCELVPTNDVIADLEHALIFPDLAAERSLRVLWLDQAGQESVRLLVD